MINIESKVVDAYNKTMDAGIPIMDDAGNYFPVKQVLHDVVDKWDTLTSEHLTSLAVAYMNLFIISLRQGYIDEAKKAEMYKKAMSELGDDLPGEMQNFVKASLNIGINIVKNEGGILTHDEYMDILSEKWSSLTDNEKNNLARTYLEFALQTHNDNKKDKNDEFTNN